MIHNLIKSNDEEVRCTCPRCGGTGYLPQYRHIENEICFKCRGARTVVYHQYGMTKQVIRTI